MARAPLPRGPLDPRLWQGRPPEDMEVGGRERALSQQPRQYVPFLFPPRTPVSPPSAWTPSAHPEPPPSPSVPKAVGLTVPPLNPALPPKKVAKIPSRFRPPTAQVTNTIGHGPKRVYLDIQARPPNIAYPPRPVPGSAADLDIVMEHCDFSTGKVSVPPHTQGLDLCGSTLPCSMFVTVSRSSGWVEVSIMRTG